MSQTLERSVRLAGIGGPDMCHDFTLELARKGKPLVGQSEIGALSQTGGDLIECGSPLPSLLLTHLGVGRFLYK